MTSTYARYSIVICVAAAFHVVSCRLNAEPLSKSDAKLALYQRRMAARERLAELEYRKRAFPTGQIPVGAFARALEQTRRADQEAKRLKGPVLSFWSNIGPAPINSSQNAIFETVSGRVSALAVDPANASHWLLGAAQGGVWETLDSGSFWFPRGDDQASLAMGALAFAPSNPSLVYAGTGEANFSADSYAGQGLLVSTNGGRNWEMLNNSFAQTAFSGIEVDSSNPQNLSASTSRGIAGQVSAGTNIPPTAPPRGIFISSNGGTNFNRILTGEATGLEMDPAHFSRQYAALGEIFGAPTNGVYRTTNGWTSWETVQGPWTTATAHTNIGRIALALSPVNSSTLFVGVSYTRYNPINDLKIYLVGIWSTTNAWAQTPTWTRLPDPDTGPYLWYSFALLGDPQDANSVYMAAFSVQQFTGGSWTDIGQNIHPDNHAMAWVPFGAGQWRLLVGNDGGVWLNNSWPSSTNWNDLSSSLAISQIYKGAIHPGPNSILTLVGTQDNGTAANMGDLAWPQIFSGDGADCAISPDNPDTDWAYSFQTDFQHGIINIFRTSDAGTDFTLVSDGIDLANAPFFVHFEKSPIIDDLFIAGTVKLWRCDNFFSATSPSWTANSPIMHGSDGQPVPLSAMAFAPSDTKGLIYAFGTEDGQLRITSTGGASWHDLDPANAVPDRFISGLAFSPSDANVLYVTLSGFDEGTPGHAGHLFKTLNALAATPTWNNVSPPVDLPNNCLVIDPGNADHILVGTDIGVWSTSNAGNSWVHEVSLPNIAVFDLRMNSFGRATAFTHGRSAYDSVTTPLIIGRIEPLDLACRTCPPEGWINPEDLVTIEFSLRNVLPIDAVNLTATMLPSPGITPIRGTQIYGALRGQGPAITEPFSFRAGLRGLEQRGAGDPVGDCGEMVKVVLHLQDGSNDLGFLTNSFRLGQPVHPLVQDFEGATPPRLPPGWLNSSSGEGATWRTTTNNPPNVLSREAPDEPFDEPIPTGGPVNFSAFSPAALGVGQSSLITPLFPVATAQAQLYFRQAFSVSNTYDGCVLEIAMGSLPFVDLQQAGGFFALNGYNRVLVDRNPLGPRAAWSGDSHGWMPVHVNLPATAAGHIVQLRWHFATSRGVTNGGWFIDSVVVTEPRCLPPVTDPVLLNPKLQGDQLTFSINTVTNRTFIVEFKTNLTDAVWQSFRVITGDGTQKMISSPTSPGDQRFFRFRVE